jgi:hypothetical protein
VATRDTFDIGGQALCYLGQVQGTASMGKPSTCIATKIEVCFEAQRKAGAVSLYNQSQAALFMTRKESEKDSERPHYYSQFWLDIAAGRRTIGGPKPEDGEALDPEAAEPVLQRRPSQVGESETFQNTSSPVNGYREEVASSDDDEEYGESEEDLQQDQDDEQDTGEYQEDSPLQDGDMPDMDLSSNEEEQDTASEEEQDEQDEPNDSLDEEDDDTKWGGRSRKKGKVVRPNKVPVKKPGKPRRGGF